MKDDAVLGYEYDPGTDRARFRRRHPIQSEAYRLQKERFVQGSPGASPIEVVLVCLITATSLIVHDLVAAQLTLRSALARFLVEFTLVPGVIIAVMFYPEHALSIWLAQVGVVVAFLALARSRALLSWHAAPSVIGPRLRFVSCFRSAFMLCTCCCILAVDFPLFPRRSIKTESFGVSVMDTGVGFVVFSGGLVSHQARSRTLSSPARALRATLPVLVLGAVRLASVRAVDYQTHVSEYGLHWNFFLTLSAVSLASHLADPLVRRWSAGVMATGAAVLAQLLISVHLDFLLYGDRRDLFSANREGLYSSLGYLSIYLAGVQVGQRLAQARTSNHWWRLVGDLSAVAAAGFAVVAALGPDSVSRRFANLPFVVWIVALNAAVLALELAYDLVGIRVPTNKTIDGGGAIVQGVDRNQLAIFLLGNLTTGVLNLSLQTLYMGDRVALALVTAYVLMISAVAAALDRARVSLKFW